VKAKTRMNLAGGSFMIGIFSVFLFVSSFFTGHAAAQAPDPSRRADLEAALEASLPSLSTCDAFLTLSERSVGGTLVVGFVIATSGAVEGVRIVERGRRATNASTLSSPRLRACALEQVALWVFPRARFENERPPRVNVETPVRFPVGTGQKRRLK